MKRKMIGTRVLAAAAVMLAFIQPPQSVAAEEAFDEAAVEQRAMKVLDAFMNGFNARDAEAHAATLQYPHYRLARGTMSFWETEAAAVQQMAQTFGALPDTGWDRSVWVERRIVTLSATKVHVATRFKRLRADGSEIGTYESLYIVVKKDGRWGVKLRSSYL